MKKIEQAKVHFQPLIRIIRNAIDYYWYTLKYSIAKIAIKAIPFILGVISFVIDGYYDLEVPILRWLAFISWGLAAIKLAWDYAYTFDRRFVREMEIDGENCNIAAPDDSISWEGVSYPWRRVTVEIQDEKGERIEESAIYVNEGIDRWINTAEAADSILIEEDKESESLLKKKIQKFFNDYYQPFLHSNHRDSQFKGIQFSNEKKWGISSDIGPDKGDKVSVIKTCYFDTYLTNIIPGRKLVFNRSAEEKVRISKDATDIPYELMPYSLDKSEGVDRLKSLDEFCASGEVGVSTLGFIKKGKGTSIRLWRQGHQTQSSRGQLVCTGSGSADWDDCKDYLGKKGGFTKAIILGMERELYEESVGKREITKKEFFKRTHTEIIGYFRWLKKGGKAEFVGISLMDMNKLVDSLSPEASELTGKREDISAHDIKTLKKGLDNLVKEKEEAPGTYISRGCSISCVAALLALKNLCDRRACNECEGKKACSADDAYKCTATYETLFNGTD